MIRVWGISGQWPLADLVCPLRAGLCYLTWPFICWPEYCKVGFPFSLVLVSDRPSLPGEVICSDLPQPWFLACFLLSLYNISLMIVSKTCQGFPYSVQMEVGGEGIGDFGKNKCVDVLELESCRSVAARFISRGAGDNMAAASRRSSCFKLSWTICINNRSKLGRDQGIWRLCRTCR